jgi:tetratricopeptide (TPR) repeat protein
LIAKFSGHPKIAEAIYEIAEDYFRLQKQERASQLLQFVLDNKPKAEAAMWTQAGLAGYYIAVGDDPNGQATVDRLIADFNDHPELAGALFEIGEEYYVKALHQMKYEGLDAQAEDYFRKGIAVWDVITNELPEAYPAIADAYLFSGICYRRLGQYEKAIEYYQKLVNNWAGYHWAGRTQFLIGKCYENLRDAGTLAESEANELIKQAYEAVVQKYPDCPFAADAWGKLGWLNFEKGRWTEAAACFELSLEKSPEDRKPVHILYALGRAYEEIGQLDKAIQVYEDFINSVPSFDPRIEEVKARLEELGG